MKKLTPSEARVQRLKDESTVFALAGLMVDTYTHILNKNQVKSAQALVRVSEVLKSDPTFLQRFMMAQQAVLAEMKKKESKIIIPKPGTATFNGA